MSSMNKCTLGRSYRCVLPGLWNRIERFKASVEFHAPIELDLFFLPLLCYPAPILQEADYAAQRIQSSQILALLTPQLNTTLHSLFSNTAPHLRAFKADRLRIPLRASWLSGLTSLETGPLSHFTGDIQQTLQILGRMPQLQRLILGHIIHSVVQDNVKISTYPTIHLDNLTYMAFCGYSTTALALVEHIKRSPSGCLINLSVRTSSSTPNDETTLRSLLLQTFAPNVEFVHGSDSLNWMLLSGKDGEVVLADRGCSNYNLRRGQRNVAELPEMSSRGIYFRFTVKNGQRSPELSLSTINTIVESPAVTKLNTLRLIIDSQTHGHLYAELFTRFTSVTILEATITSLSTLDMFIGDSNGPVPFPNCTTLRVLCASEAAVYSRLIYSVLRVRALSPLSRYISTVKLYRTQRVEEVTEQLKRVPYISETRVEDDREEGDDKIITLLYTIA